MNLSSNTSRRRRNERHVLQQVRRRYQIDGGAAGTPPPPPKQPTGNTSAPQDGGRRSKKNRTKKAHPWRRAVLVVLVILIAGGGIFGYRILAASNKISVANTSIIGQLKDLLFSSGNKLKGEDDDRINIMLLAVGGEGHSGENLTDTIMIASIKPSTGDIALLSIPRDLYVQVPGKEFYSKINAVHAYGEAEKKDLGPELLRQKVEEITNLPIHYYARVDFTAFKTIVDAVGGVTITIPNGFFDYWHKISFPAGTEKMNGDRALAYARARYVEGPEGGDFKRAGRQQQLLLAIREKVFSVNTALDFTAINSIIDSLSKNIRTDMQLWEMKRFFEIARTVKKDDIRSVVLTTGPNGVLVGSTEVLDGLPASILKTRTGDYSEIQNIAANIFSDSVSKTVSPIAPPGEAPKASPSPTTSPAATTSGQEESTTVEIRNGTNLNGLAAKAKDTVTSKGYSVTKIGNAATRTIQKTEVYQIANTAADSTQAIAELLGASSSTGLPSGEAKTDAQVLVILGADAQK